MQFLQFNVNVYALNFKSKLHGLAGQLYLLA